MLSSCGESVSTGGPIDLHFGLRYCTVVGIMQTARVVMGMFSQEWSNRTCLTGSIYTHGQQSMV